MRKDHRPYWLKKLLLKYNRWYVNHFFRPQFDALGCEPMIIQPRSCEIHGSHIFAGNFLHLVSSPQKPVRFTTWQGRQHKGAIHIGDYCLIAPGVEISASTELRIGSNTMIASDCLIHDCDWHGLYNRTRPFRCTSPVTLGENVWLGARCIITKGVSIGDNSVIGAGSVVTKNIPANVVAAGNPAKVVKPLNSKQRMLKREFLFQKGEFYWQNQSKLDEYLLADNSLADWLRSEVRPTTKD